MQVKGWWWWWGEGGGASGEHVVVRQGPKTNDQLNRMTFQKSPDSVRLHGLSILSQPVILVVILFISCMITVI